MCSLEFSAVRFQMRCGNYQILKLAIVTLRFAIKESPPAPVRNSIVGGCSAVPFLSSPLRTGASPRDVSVSNRVADFLR